MAAMEILISFALAACVLTQSIATAPLIVDTDMNVDDMAALVYLLRNGADIKGITVSATGFSAQTLFCTWLANSNKDEAAA